MTMKGLGRCLYLFIWYNITRGGIFSMASTALPPLTRKWCFEDAFQIQYDLSQQRCPYNRLQENGKIRKINCTGQIVNNNSIHDDTHCVNYTLELLLNQRSNTSIFTAKYCNVPKCIIALISITCDLRNQIAENATVFGLSSNKEFENHPDLILAFICGITGCVIGILLTLTIRRYKDRLSRNNIQTPSILDNPNQTITLDSFHLYSDVEDTVKMVVKATQVPSLNDKSPISARSRSSNVYYELSDKMCHYHSTSSIQKPNSRTSSTSDGSIINKRSRLSSQSSAESRGDQQSVRRGSDESKRYFQLEKQ